MIVKFKKEQMDSQECKKDNKKNSKKKSQDCTAETPGCINDFYLKRIGWPGQPYLLEQAGQSWGAQPRNFGLTQLV